MTVTQLGHSMQLKTDVTSTSHTCSECRNPIAGKSVTCGAKCRKRRERRQKDQHSAWILALHELGKMRDGIKRGETIKDYREQLIRLKDEINDLLLLVHDQEEVARREMLNDYWTKNRSW